MNRTITTPTRWYPAVARSSSRSASRSAKKNYPELKSWLVETADVFREGVLPLFDKGGVLLTSATLASGAVGNRGGGQSGSQGGSRSFAYARRRLGLAGAVSRRDSRERPTVPSTKVPAKAARVGRRGERMSGRPGARLGERRGR